MSFSYQPLYEKQKDTTVYRKLTSDHVRVESFNGQDVLIVEPAALELLAQEAISDVFIFCARLI